MALHNPAGQAELVSSSKNTGEKLPQGFMHGGAGKATEAGVLASCDVLPPFSSPLVLAWMFLEGCLVTFSSQREGEDHIPEQGHGCQSD